LEGTGFQIGTGRFSVTDWIFQDAEECTASEVGSVTLREILEATKDPKRLAVALETACVAHAVVEGDLSAVAKRWMTQVVRVSENLQEAALRVLEGKNTLSGSETSSRHRTCNRAVTAAAPLPPEPLSEPVNASPGCTGVHSRSRLYTGNCVKNGVPERT
jgi:hypothetical protein